MSGRDPAYPGEFVKHPAGEVGNSVPIMERGAGLTKREAFAMAAMQGLLANPGGPIQANGMAGWGLCNCTPENVAGLACELADATLAALDQEG